MTKTKGKTASRWAAALVAALTGLSGNASAILLDRGPDMVYDTVLDITWTRQAGDGVLRNWPDANAWAAGLVFGGFDDWRLPYASVIGGAGPINSLPAVPCTGAGGADEVTCRDNEMAYMFYYNLDGSPAQDKTGNQTAVGGEMLTGIDLFYWSGTERIAGIAWYWAFVDGGQGAVRDAVSSAWAVRPGDVCAAQPRLCAAVVPEPGSLLLLGLAAMGLGWSRRRK